MVRHTLQTVRPDLKIIEVVATRGKHVRAEPISALYTSGRVSHVGTMTTLEDQYCQITASGFEGKGSPDHADAAIWALTELLPPMVRKTYGNIDWNAAPAGRGWQSR
jgi:phage terminase large subunit-like protein